MKQILSVILTAILASVSRPVMVAAQNPCGHFSAKPMAGVNISTYGRATYDDSYHNRVRFTAGFEVEYGLTDRIGLSLGMAYSQQGADIDATIDNVVDYGEGPIFVRTKVDGKLTADYLNIPLLANIYIPALKGLCLKTGVQMGVLVNDRMSATTQVLTMPYYVVNEDGSVTTGANIRPQHYVVESTTSDVCHSVDFGIPIGVSYEYRNVCLDARYYFGLTRPDKTETPDNARNRYLSITLGYRFGL